MVCGARMSSMENEHKPKELVNPKISDPDGQAAVNAESSETDLTNKAWPDSQDDQVRSNDTGSNGWAIFVGILAFIATVATIITVIWAWQALRTDAIRAFTTAGLIVLAAALASLALRLRAREFSRRLALDLAIAAGVCICGATAITLYVNWTEPSPPRVARAASSFVRVDVPRPAIPGAPVPLVCWQNQVAGGGSLPDGDVLVVAVSTAKSIDWYFNPYSSWHGSAWNVTVRFGSQPDIRVKFKIAVFAMPKTWENYIDSLYTSAKPSAGGGWIYNIIPPYSVDLFEETVERSPTGC
jgi:hypothetical protein